MKLVKKIKVRNPMGIHTRPAACIVQLLQNSKCEVSLTYRKETVNARSILNILMLAIHQHASVTITVENIDEENAELTMQKLVDAFECGFQEPILPIAK
jgi:phosphocarrier protein HPr